MVGVLGTLSSLGERMARNHERSAAGAYFGDIVTRKLSRRSLFKAGAATVAAATVGAGVRVPPAQAAETLNFRSLPPNLATDALSVAAGHRTEVLLRWGDPLFAGAPPWDPSQQTAAAQERLFGYNADFVAFMPLPLGSRTADRGLLWVNHEYTNPELMFAGYNEASPTKDQADIELAAHGASIVEVRRDGSGRWQPVLDSPLNRRLTANTPMDITGPAAGSDWMKTGADPTGRRVLGMLNNCGGGWTPWGTILTCEENFHQYFANWAAIPPNDPRKGVHARYGLPAGASERKWERFHSRFDLGSEPNEPNRFGWVVEVDPYTATFVPRKRTALGRMLHEAATVALAKDSRVAVYTGDDARFEYVYKFVSTRPYQPTDRTANLSLLDEGTLHVARFNDDGSGEWLPLVFGQGPLTQANAFFSQADVLVQARRAADLLGATMMDRPEDIEPNPVNGKVYLVMTNNNQRAASGARGVNAANPRANNRWGHIIELEEAGGDAAASRFRWEMFMVCGDPADAGTYFAGFPKDRVTAIGAPDNVLFDVDGNLWICTDGQPSAVGFQDSVYVAPVAGPDRGHLRRFFNSVTGSEVASAAFNPDSTALFISVQHPGEGGTLEKPVSRFPDGGVVRPSVVVATHAAGSRIGVVSEQDAAPVPAPSTPAMPMPAALPNTGDSLGLVSGMGVAAGAAALTLGSLLRLRSRRSGGDPAPQQDDA